MPHSRRGQNETVTRSRLDDISFGPLGSFPIAMWNLVKFWPKIANKENFDQSSLRKVRMKTVWCDKSVSFSKIRSSKIILLSTVQLCVHQKREKVLHTSV